MCKSAYVCLQILHERIIKDSSEAFILNNWVTGGTNDWVEKGEG